MTKDIDKASEIAREAGLYLDGANQQQPLYVLKPEELTKFYTRARADLEAELLEQARIVGMGGERELKLMAENAKLRDSLQEMVQMMDSGDEHGAGSNWHTKARAALGEK